MKRTKKEGKREQGMDGSRRGRKRVLQKGIRKE